MAEREGSPRKRLSLSVVPLASVEAPLPPNSADWDTCRADRYYTAEEREELREQVWRDRLAAISASQKLVEAGAFRWRKGTKLLGAGSFGAVWEAIRGDTGELIVAKEVITTGSGLRRCSFQDLQNEISVLRSLSHPHVVKYLGCTIMQDGLCILTEYCSGGSIAACLTAFGALKEPVVRSFTYQIISGLGFLHRQCIVHRDVKNGNILLSTQGVVKLADFGASKHLMDCSGSLKGTYQYMAPEALRGETGRFSDIWSVGICVDEMLRGYMNPAVRDKRLAVTALDDAAMLQAPAPPDSASEDAQDFIRACLCVQPLCRPNAYRLSKHAFVAGNFVPPQRIATPCDASDSPTSTTHSRSASAHSSRASRVPSTASRTPSSESCISRESPELVDPPSGTLGNAPRRLPLGPDVSPGSPKMLATYRFPAFESSRLVATRRGEGGDRTTLLDTASDVLFGGSTLLESFDPLLSRSKSSNSAQLCSFDRLLSGEGTQMQIVREEGGGAGFASPGAAKPAKARRDTVAIASGFEHDDASPLVTASSPFNSVAPSHWQHASPLVAAGSPFNSVAPPHRQQGEDGGAHRRRVSDSASSLRRRSRAMSDAPVPTSRLSAMADAPVAGLRGARTDEGEEEDYRGRKMLPCRVLLPLSEFIARINVLNVLWAFLHARCSALYATSPLVRLALAPVRAGLVYCVGKPHPCLRTTWCVVDNLADGEAEKEYLRQQAPWCRKKITDTGMFLLFCLVCRLSVSSYKYSVAEMPSSQLLLRVVFDLAIIICFSALTFFPCRDPFEELMCIQNADRLISPIGILVTFGEPEMMSLLRLNAFMLKDLALLGDSQLHALHCGLATAVRTTFCLSKIYSAFAVGGLSQEALFAVVSRELSGIFVMLIWYLGGLYVVVRAHRDWRVRWFETNWKAVSPVGGAAAAQRPMAPLPPSTR